MVQWVSIDKEAEMTTINEAVKAACDQFAADNVGDVTMGTLQAWRNHIDALVNEAMDEWTLAYGFTEEQVNGETDWVEPEERPIPSYAFNDDGEQVHDYDHGDDE